MSDLLRGDIRGSLVQAGQEACGYMNCKLFVQAVTGVPKLDALPARPFSSEADLTAGDVLKWGIGLHWAIYIGDGEIMEVEEWGADSRIVSLAEVVQEIDPPDMVFSTVTTQHEVLLREYVRGLLAEAAKSPEDLPADWMVYVDNIGDKYRIELAGDDRTVGSITIGPAGTDTDPCLGSYQVNTSQAEQGWGPMLYDVAMEIASMYSSGLIADRNDVSDEAQRVWQFYQDNRPDVEVAQLDDLYNTLTPDEYDNCLQQVAWWDVDHDDEAGDEFTRSPLSKLYGVYGSPTIDRLKTLSKIEFEES